MLDLRVLTLSACAQFTLPAARSFSSPESRGHVGHVVGETEGSGGNITGCP